MEVTPRAKRIGSAVGSHHRKILFWDNPIRGFTMRSWSRPLTKSLRSQSQRRLVSLLARARRESGLTQAQLAARLHRPQSFVSKIESGERRLDVVELVEVLRALHCDPVRFFRLFAKGT